MKTPFNVGITGGIGSGKSTVCDILQAMNYPVYNSDQRAKDLMESDPQIRQSLIDAFGEKVFDHGVLNRSHLAKIIFNDPSKRDQINAIIHPAVRSDFQSWSKQQTTAIVFQESALLFETGGYQLLDFNVLVVAPIEDRIQRVLVRDQTDLEAIQLRMNNQLADEEKIPLADFIIENGQHSVVLPQILLLLEKLHSII